MANYTFSLIGVNIEKVDHKYGLSCSFLDTDNNIPDNATKITDLDIVKKTPDIVSFLDESKRLRKCTVSMIDFGSGKEIKKGFSYKCFWDKNTIPEGVRPIGCPVKYVPNRAVKTYHSEINKEQYSIAENITVRKSNELKGIQIDNRDYYQTDGVFCSFNCCMAYIQCEENKVNPLYRYSEMLLIQLYSELSEHSELSELSEPCMSHELDPCELDSCDSDQVKARPEIIPAPHWRLLTDFGGHLSIEKFRESFNKVLYVDYGRYIKPIFVSIGKLYEDQLKF